MMKAFGLRRYHADVIPMGPANLSASFSIVMTWDTSTRIASAYPAILRPWSNELFFLGGGI